MSDKETTPQGGIFGGQNVQDAERRANEREEQNTERELDQHDKVRAAEESAKKDYAEWQRQNPDNNITHDPMDADNRKQERDRWEARQRDQRDQEREDKERAEAEKERKAAQEKGGSWLNRSVTADLAGVAKAVAGGEELTGQNSLTSSLAQLIKKGQAKAQEKLSQEKERDRENQR